MNKVDLVGRLTKDVEPHYSTGENVNASCRFTVAVNRKFKNKETGQYDADFISCVAFGKTCEFIAKWFHKGDPIGISGNIRTGSYTNKDGIKVYTTDVYVDDVEFVGGKNNSDTGVATGSAPAQKPVDNSFMNIPDNGSEELPW